MDTPTKSNRHRHLDGRLRLRLIIYTLAALVTLGITLFHIARSEVSILSSLLSLALGLVVGMASARMFRLSWDGDAGKVISRLDLVGGLILAAYVVFSVLKQSILIPVVPTAELGEAGMAVVSGVMFGRLLGTGGNIRLVLRDVFAPSSEAD